MTKKCVSRFSLYRKYEEDLWGTLFFFRKKKMTRIIKLMHLKLIETNHRFRARVRGRLNMNLKFSFDSSEAPRKKKHYMAHVAHKNNIRKLRWFYGVMTERNFKYYIIRSRFNVKQMSNYFLVNFENRIDVILMRLNIFKSVFEIRQLLRHRKIFINGKLITHGSVLIKKNDLISFHKGILELFFRSILERRFLFPIQANIEWEFSLMLFLITTPFGSKLLKKAKGFYYPTQIKKSFLQIAL